METKTIKSKHLDNRIVEVKELADYSGKIIGYSVVITYKQRDIIGSGAARLEEIKFGDNKDKAMDFFGNQT